MGSIAAKRGAIAQRGRGDVAPGIHAGHRVVIHRGGGPRCRLGGFADARQVACRIVVVAHPGKVLTGIELLKRSPVFVVAVVFLEFFGAIQEEYPPGRTIADGVAVEGGGPGPGRGVFLVGTAQGAVGHFQRGAGRGARHSVGFQRPARRIAGHDGIQVIASAAELFHRSIFVTTRAVVLVFGETDMCRRSAALGHGALGLDAGAVASCVVAVGGGQLVLRGGVKGLDDLLLQHALPGAGVEVVEVDHPGDVGGSRAV